MNQSLEDLLRQEVQESSSQWFAGWEFTPAMGEKVLRHARRTTSRGLWRHPGTWVAVGAAALLVLMSLERGPLLQDKDAGQMVATSSGAESQFAPDEDPPFATAQDEAPEMTMPKTQSFKYSPSLEGALAPPPREDTGAEVPSRRHVKTTALVVPRSSSDAGNQGPEGGGMTPPGEDQGLGLAWLQGPLVAELHTGGIRALAPTESAANLNLQWEQSLEGVTRNSLMASSADGHLAVSAGNRVYLVDSAGGSKGFLPLSTLPVQLLWGDNGRLAVLCDNQVRVYQEGRLLFLTAVGPDAAISFGRNQELLVSSRDENGQRLMVLDQNGKVKVKITWDGVGRGLLVGSEPVIVAGSRGYASSGELIWQVNFRPASVAALAGGERIVMQDQQKALGVRARDGVPLWEAKVQTPEAVLQRIRTSKDGKSVVLLAQFRKESVLWVLDQDGKVRYSDRLDQVRDVLLSNSTLYLLTPTEVLLREIEN